MQYRKDIQILRGISVLMVVLYHLEIKGFSNGFLGVDIFFVISGYLMAVLYNPAKKIDFFIKRAKRLLPAYFVIILITLVCCIVITTPNEYGSVTTQSLFAITFLSNIGYWLENSYFSKAAFNPLLHLWSLAVEIQFYLIIPLLYSIFKKYKYSFIITLLVSLGLCIIIIDISTKTSFFMTPLRLWEFLIGYGISTYVTPHILIKRNLIIGWLSTLCLFLLIGIPMMKTDGSALGFMHGHPGIHTLIIALATGTILAFGLPRKVLNLKIAGLFEKLGQYSYSIYLVHFPVIVLLLYQPFLGTALKASNTEQLVLLGILISVLSFLMYQYIENPLRTYKYTPHFLLITILSILILLPMGKIFQQLKYPEQEMSIYQAWTDRSEYRCGKINRLISPRAITCQITTKKINPEPTILLVGNSHADSIKTVFASVAQTRNISVYFIVENNPLMQGGIKPIELINEAKHRKANTIVLHYSLDAIDITTIEQLTILANDNNINVRFIMPVPTWNEHVPMSLWKHLRQQRALQSMSIKDYDNKTHELKAALSKIKLTNFKSYSVGEIFCRDDCLLTNDVKKPLYFDTGHLTLTGSELMRKLFEIVISNKSQD